MDKMNNMNKIYVMIIKKLIILINRNFHLKIIENYKKNLIIPILWKLTNIKSQK